MKKTLLFGLLSLTFYSTAQMTQANEPTISTVNTMYLCDSFATNYAGITGPAVTWDYSNVAGYAGQTRDVSVLDPSTTTYASDFASSTFAIQVGNNLVTYYSSTSSERSSQGFVFSEPSLGDVIAKFDTDNEIVATYPFAYGSSVDDAFAGNLDYMGGSTTPATGMGHSSIDGAGTLMLPGTTLNGVIRLKQIDTSWATITVPFPIGDVEFIREQYEYYDYTVSNLPVFIHSTITVQNVGATNPISSQSLVLSYYAPTQGVGLNELSNLNFSVYPNPATEQVTFSGNFSDATELEIIDQTGRVVLSTQLSNGQSVSVADLNSGMYIVRIADNGQVSTTTLVKK